MEYQQALGIGKQRRYDAALTLSAYVRERATEVCAVKPAKGSTLNVRDWEPVGQENFRDICISTGFRGDKEAYLLIVDGDGVAKACTCSVYPMRIAMQMVWAIPLPAYVGKGGALVAEVQEAAMRKVQGVPQMPEP